MRPRIRSIRDGARAAAFAFGLAAMLGGAGLPVARAADDAAASAPLTPPTTAASAPALDALAQDAATLTVFNRPVAVFRASLPGVPPAERARRAQEEVLRVVQAGGPGAVTTAPFAQGSIVLIDSIGVFQLLPGDLVAGQTVDNAVSALKQAVDERREARSVALLLRSTGFAALATLVFAIAVWLLRRLRHGFARSLAGLAQRHGQRLAFGGTSLFSSERLFSLARLLTALVYYLLLALLAVQWLSVMLRLFPYTRRWGEELTDSGIGLVGQIVGAIVSSLPGLGVAIVIFFIARGVLGLLAPFFAQVERGELSLPWIDRYTVRATRGLVHIGVWLFALAMAYPYLPGSHTEAFQGISVVVGLMLSLGSSNVIGQAISGLILTYSRTLRLGEYVRIGEVEGTVTEMSPFTIRIRTGLGEELTLPNTLIVNTVTKNYSRTVKGSGYVVDTVLTIGYDTPWRQVHAMMIEAALRTEGVLAAPEPHVFQTALSDFYVEYRVIAQAIATDPRPRAQVLTDLHAHLQDVFNENGVQIMSPHYLSDPADAKVVLPEHWNPPIVARRPG